MRRIAFRRILPIIQVALFLAVSVAEHESELSKQATLETFGGWDLRTDKPESFVSATLLTVNLPVCIVLLPLLLVGVQESFWPGTAIFALGVSLLWFWVGIWVDRRLGLIRSPREDSSRLQRGLAWIELCLLAGAVIIAVATVRLRWPRFVVLPAGIFAWSMFLGWTIILKMRRWRVVRDSRARPSVGLPNPPNPQ